MWTYVNPIVRTGQSVANQNKYVLHSVHSSEFLEETKVKQGIGGSIGQKNRVSLSPRLSVDLANQSQFVRGDVSRSLITLCLLR